MHIICIYIMLCFSSTCISVYICVLQMLRINCFQMRSYVAIIRVQGSLYCSCCQLEFEQALTARNGGIQANEPTTCCHLQTVASFDVANALGVY